MCLDAMPLETATAIIPPEPGELLVDGEGWMDMVRNRNRTAHTYNESVAREIETLIAERYYPLLQDFLDEMTRREAAE